MTDAAQMHTWTIDATHGQTSGLMVRPAHARALVVVAHGAGAGMQHAWMEQMAQALAQVGLASLRYQFPYMLSGRRKPPDRPAVLCATVRSAVAYAQQCWPDLPLYAGGKSMGGRMTAVTESETPLAVRGLIFFGFPLHPPGKPSTTRALPLARVHVPMLFMQGSRDAMAPIELLAEVLQEVGPRASLQVVEQGDHGLLLPKRLHVNDAAALQQVAGRVLAWINYTNPT